MKSASPLSTTATVPYLERQPQFAWKPWPAWFREVRLKQLVPQKAWAETLTVLFVKTWRLKDI